MEKAYYETRVTNWLGQSTRMHNAAHKSLCQAFLDADTPKNGKVVLDFNKAYSPPCAFTPYATCPLPPRENLRSDILGTVENWDTPSLPAATCSGV